MIEGWIIDGFMLMMMDDGWMSHKAHSSLDLSAMLEMFLNFLSSC